MGQVEVVTFGGLSEQRPPVRVVLQVVRDVQDRVRSDSVASIGTIGLLGDKYVALSMGTPGAPQGRRAPASGSSATPPRMARISARLRRKAR